MRRGAREPCTGLRAELRRICPATEERQTGVNMQAQDLIAKRGDRISRLYAFRLRQINHAQDFQCIVIQAPAQAVKNWF